MIAANTKQFSGKSGQIISGLNTTGSDLFFSGTWSAIANTDAQILADFYAHYDEILTIEAGQMIGHW